MITIEHDLIDTQPHIAASVDAHELQNLLGKTLSGFCRIIAFSEIEHARATADLTDQRVELAQKGTFLIIPNNHIAVGSHETGTKRVVCVPKLHARTVAGIANTERIKQQHTTPIARLQATNDTIEPIGAHQLKVGCLQARRMPLRPSELGRTNFNTIAIVWTAIIQVYAARGINRVECRRVCLWVCKRHHLAGVAVKATIHHR